MPETFFLQRLTRRDLQYVRVLWEISKYKLRVEY